jgi:nucleotide-binding universal stress UspA family protein
MKNEIVVGLDDSPSGKAALRWAAQQSRSTGAVLRAVHALDWPYGAGFTEPRHQIKPMELTHEEIDDSYRDAITAVFEAVSPSPDWVLEFVRGYAGEALVRLSKDAELVVVGTREHVGLGRLLVGSVSHYCLRHAACPVVAVPIPAPPGTESAEREKGEVGSSGNALLVVGLDRSAESLAAARYAASEAEMRGCDILLVHAFPAAPANAPEMEAVWSASRTSAEQLVASVAAQLAISPRVHIHTLAEPGDPMAVLEDVARQGEMLVLGRDHVSWGKRVLQGKVTSHVTRRVTCPVVVVPRGWRTGHVGKPPPVVVALDGQTNAESALSLAFREAQLRATRLVVLHAEPIGTSARDVAAAGFDLAVLLAKWKQDHPDVTVSTVLVSGDPDVQLVRWSRSATVLVVGRPHQRGWGSWVRSIARNVMSRTRCPLIIAPQNPVPVRGKPASAAVART